MIRSHWLFAGIVATFAFSWFGLAMVPQMQLGTLPPQVDEDMGDIYPIDKGGIADQGRAVYAANGCFYCHSQQVRDQPSDLARGWGTRRTVARDYLYDNPVFLGTMRNGPDLANIGSPQRVRDAGWHYLHLYDPRSVFPDSIMPPFQFLFEKRQISGERSVDALDLWGKDAPEDGYEILPTPQAKALVAYLLSLDRTHPLREAKEPEPAAK
ncbi:MAG: cbb3-type cytochrome c oxidase subunit II [Verrucomicrobiota bacterium]|nr:cbb3-type cytochrome c oxidase subunit II [Verrucomicrobiota bacterium]